MSPTTHFISSTISFMLSSLVVLNWAGTHIMVSKDQQEHLWKLLKVEEVIYTGQMPLLSPYQYR